MNIIKAKQGSLDWHAHRARHYNASEAAAMLGASKYQTRSDLLREKATGLVPDVDAATQKRFDDGHKFEAQARAWAEEIIGDELYPVTVAGTINELPLSASLDGLTMANNIAFEHKTLNAALEAALDAGQIPAEYHPQMEQQLLLTGAKRCLFMASNGSRETMRHEWYEPRPDMRQQVLSGWAQFHEDLQGYEPAPRDAAVNGDKPSDLPALRVEVTGKVLASNLDQYRKAAVTVFRGIKTDLKTDQDFADAESTVKWCKGVEDKIDQAKEATLAQTEDIDHVMRTLDELKEECRQTRLNLEKSVKVEKESRRYEIIQSGKDALAKHIDGINKTLGKLQMPIVPADFAAAVHGKKTLASVRDAVDGELARAKIEANRIADQARINLDVLRTESVGYETLFPDSGLIVISKSEDDLRNLIRARIAEHKESESKRIAQEVERAETGRLRKEAQATAPVVARPVITHPVEIQPIATQSPPVAADDDAPWVAELIDILALCAAVAAGTAPVELVQINQAAANRLATALKGAVEYPGLRFVATESLAVRT